MYFISVVSNCPFSMHSFIQDTTDFLRKLKSIDNIPAITILATMDVTSLYTNITHADGLQTICNATLDETVSRGTCQLTNFVLTHNYFKFEADLHLQTSGTAMGTRMAPQ